MQLTDLDKVLRHAGVPVVEVAGWRDRGRGGDGGQYLAGRPTGRHLGSSPRRALRPSGRSNNNKETPVNITANVHEVRQVNIIREGTLSDLPTATTSVQIVDEGGEVLTLTLFHPVGDLPVTISEK